MSVNPETVFQRGPTHVFIDTEFTSLSTPELLSIGLVANDGRECYVELAAKQLRVNDFVVRVVLPQWGLMPGRAASTAELGRRVDVWLSELGDQAIDVVYDYEADFDLMRNALHLARLWPRWSGVLVAEKVGYLASQAVSDEAMYSSWADSLRRDGIRRHHALADARALRAGYRAIHDAHFQIRRPIHPSQGISS